MERSRMAVYMPAYEPKKAHIRAAVESVRAQTYTGWTLLINDDASVREETESHVRDFLVDPRITFRKNPKNLGIGGNWNACWHDAPLSHALAQTSIPTTPFLTLLHKPPSLPAGRQAPAPSSFSCTNPHPCLPAGRPNPFPRWWKGVLKQFSLPLRGRARVGETTTNTNIPPLLGRGGEGERLKKTGEGVRGVRQQSSEFVAFLFHDDLWEPTYLEKMIAALDHYPSAGFAAANHTYTKEGEVPTAPFYEELHTFVQKNIVPGLHEHGEFLRWWMSRGLKPNVIGEPSFVVLRRSLMEQVGPFNASMVQFLDSEYWARCLLKADWVYVAEDLGKFRVHPAGMSAVNEGLGRGVFERFQTLQTVVAGLPPEERSAGNAAIVNALSGMIGQYFARRKQGRNVNSHGSGGLKRFILRHPILLLRVFARWCSGNQ